MRAQPKTPFPLRRDPETGRHCCPSAEQAALMPALQVIAEKQIPVAVAVVAWGYHRQAETAQQVVLVL